MSERTDDVPETREKRYASIPEDIRQACARGNAVDVIQRAERVAKEADSLRAFVTDHAWSVPAELDQKAIDTVIGAVTARLDAVAAYGAEVIATLRSQPMDNPAPQPKSVQIEATGEQKPVLLGIADRVYDLDEKSEELLMFAQDHFAILLGLGLEELGDFYDETASRLENVREQCGDVQNTIREAHQRVRRTELHPSQ
jgi:hypothetical protein